MRDVSMPKKWTASDERRPGRKSNPEFSIFWNCVARLPRSTRSFIALRLLRLMTLCARWAAMWAPWNFGKIDFIHLHTDRWAAYSRPRNTNKHIAGDWDHGLE